MQPLINQNQLAPTTLTGFTSSAGMLMSTDTVIQAIQKLDGNVATNLSVAIAYADSVVVGLWDDRGNFNAAINTYPTTGGSGSLGAINKGDIWTVSSIATSGPMLGVVVGSTVRSLIDSPTQLSNNWTVMTSGVGYVPESVTNKSTDGTLAANSTVLYPSQSAVKTYVGNIISTSPAFTGTPTSTTAVAGTNTTQIATTAFVTNAINTSLTTPRVLSITTTGTAPVNVDITDVYSITALAMALSFATPTGTAHDSQPLMYTIKDNGAARALTYSAAFASRGATLPTTTVVGKYMRLGFFYNANTATWDLVGLSQEA